MLSTYSKRTKIRIDAIMSALPKDASPLLVEFTRLFFLKMPVVDLERIDPTHAVNVVKSAFEFAKLRPVPGPQIRIFTPNEAVHGWHTRHLVIELINDDMPFLLDSLSAELSRQGFTLFETIHPIFKVSRDASGHLQKVNEPASTEGGAESFIHFEVSALPEDITAEGLRKDLENVLAHVRLAFSDWKAMTQRLGDVSTMLASVTKGDVEHIKEAAALLDWLRDRNFIFLGYSRLDKKAAPISDASLGICKIDPIAPDLTKSDAILDIRKSDHKSIVHRPVLMDVVIVKELDAKGNPTGQEHRFFGLFTSVVYYQSVDAIPVVRQKIKHVLINAGFESASHDGKSLKTILEFLPRDVILQTTETELFELSLGILALESKPTVRLFARRDSSGRFISCMVFVPREYFSTGLRKQIQRTLENAYHATSETFSTQISESALTRLHVILRLNDNSFTEVDTVALEAEIARFSMLWSDLLHERIFAQCGIERGERLFRAYANAFSNAYINRYDIGSAVHDIEKMEEAREHHISAAFYQRKDQADFFHVKIFNAVEEIALSDIIPVLENMGFRIIEEHPFLIQAHGLSPVWIRDIKLALPQTSASLHTLKPLLEEALVCIWRKLIESDRFNALTLHAGLNTKQVNLLRAYAKYVKQSGFTYAQTAIENALIAYPSLARILVELFETRFAPNTNQEAEHTINEAIDASLMEVSSIADDRIIRRLRDVIMATLRTNYFQRDAIGADKPVLSFKFDSALVPELPLPRPFREIFVYSARVEGIHLRGGKVARGGLRWSDRHEDYRTEVLGLMKAQQVKNSVIVPVGSKGGFVVKQPPAAGAREAMQEEGIACYKLYLSGLLDITDNIVSGKIVPPADVRRHDEDDPYLVVAADKGTASFSDIANNLAQTYQFWLGDAFASGGSAGYDHKEMAITARGAWVSVVRHFSEMGVDIGEDIFTAVGIGDMSGDVFGNGMLLSENMQLIAAFNHMHIFIDPTPEVKKSFNERKRLFHMERSTWKDYDARLISRGGGVFERSAKNIKLSKEARSALNIQDEILTPDEVIKAILRAPVDLLWNGGIGTYVKAESETHEQVGDRSNNAVRINGKELRCKLVGEGGNLGFTQRGRIEYARAGGRINTDAIDNSGGVDCSDHEVNIKIALRIAMNNNKLTLQERNELLEAMTDEVASLVLKDNILQTRALTIARLQGATLLDSQVRFMLLLEKQGLLNREVEFLPSDSDILELRSKNLGLTRPELAVLLAYSKLTLSKLLIDSSLPDEAYFNADLRRYFPKRICDIYADEIKQHPLKREIIATVATNSLVNRVGITFFYNMMEESGLPAREVAAAYTVVRDVYSLRKLWQAIEALTHISAEAQVEMIVAINRLVERATLWLLRNERHPLAMESLLDRLKPSVEMLKQEVDAIHSDATLKAHEKIVERLTALNVPAELVREIANLEVLASAFDIIQVAEATRKPLRDVGVIYFALGATLKLGWLRHYASKIVAKSHWEHVALQTLTQDLYDEQRRLTSELLASGKDIQGLMETDKDDIERFERFIADLKNTTMIDTSVLMVALRNIKSLGVS